jgi:hypothetical protein
LRIADCDGADKTVMLWRDMVVFARLQTGLRSIPALLRPGVLLVAATTSSPGFTATAGYPPPPGPYPFTDGDLAPWPARTGASEPTVAPRATASPAHTTDSPGIASPLSANNLFGAERAPGQQRPTWSTEPPAPPAWQPETSRYPDSSQFTVNDGSPPGSDFSMDFSRKPGRYGSGDVVRGAVTPAHTDGGYSARLQPPYGDSYYLRENRHTGPETTYGQPLTPQFQPESRPGGPQSSPPAQRYPQNNVGTNPAGTASREYPQETADKRETPPVDGISPRYEANQADATNRRPIPETTVFRPPTAN